MAFGRCTPRVRRFLKEAYVRGAMAKVATPEAVPFEGSSKRAYRNRWNRGVLKRANKVAGRQLKMKARFKS